MTNKPPYVVHSLAEESMTVDWFYGRGHVGTKIKQLFLIAVGWFFAILPVAVTTWALVNRDRRDWGPAAEKAFATWDQTMIFLGFFVSFFLVFYFALFVINLASVKGRNKRRTYDEQRLSRRLALADEMYAEKFGPPELRIDEKHVQIQPYGDIETFELRGRYRNFGGE